jgi:hypothetical protein
MRETSQSYKYFFLSLLDYKSCGVNLNLSASSETARGTHECNPLVFHTRRLRLFSCTGRPGNSWSSDLIKVSPDRECIHTYVNSSCRLRSLDQCQCVRIYTCILYLFTQQVVEAETSEEGRLVREWTLNTYTWHWYWYGTIMHRPVRGSDSWPCIRLDLRPLRFHPKRQTRWIS